MIFTILGHIYASIWRPELIITQAFYFLVVSTVGAALLCSYLLQKRYHLAVTKAHYRFFAQLSVLLFSDLMNLFIHSQNYDSNFAVACQSFLRTTVYIMASLNLYQIPNFVMQLCSAKQMQRRLLFFKKLSTLFVIGILFSTIFSIFTASTALQLWLTALFISTMAVIAFVLLLCAQHVRSAKGSFTATIAKSILILLSLFFIGFILDFIRAGYMIDILGMGRLRQYLQAELNIRFYTICYFIWFLVFLKNSIEILINNIPEKTQALSEQALDTFSITDREKEVILLVAQGKSQKEICDTLFIALPTVKRHMQNIYKKTGAKNRLTLLHTLHIDALNPLLQEP